MLLVIGGLWWGKWRVFHYVVPEDWEETVDLLYALKAI
jgi:hypothetical protein